MVAPSFVLLLSCSFLMELWQRSVVPLGAGGRLLGVPAGISEPASSQLVSLGVWMRV